MNKINAIALFLLLVIPNINAFELLEPVRILDKPMVMYLNPAGIPERYAENDPRIIALAGSPELQAEERIKIFEEELRARLDEWSSVPKSTLVLTYEGRTAAGCYDYLDRISTVCVLSESDYDDLYPSPSSVARAGVASIRGIPYRLINDSLVNFNERFLFQDFMGTDFLHEIGHIIGLNHFDDNFAVMSTASYAKNFPISLQPDDIAGVQSHYPFPKSCAPEVNNVNGKDGFFAEVYFDGYLYRARFNYYVDSLGPHLLIEGEVEVNPPLGRSCALKLDGTGLNIPYLNLDGVM